MINPISYIINWMATTYITQSQAAVLIFCILLGGTWSAIWLYNEMLTVYRSEEYQNSNFHKEAKKWL